MCDNALSSDDVLLRLPNIHHLQIDSRTLLEVNRSILNDIDDSEVASPTMKNQGTLGRLLTAPIQRVKGSKYEHGIEYTQFSSQPAKDRPKLHCSNARNEHNPFPDSSLLDQVDDAQHDEIQK